jgi:succinyl-CoA synthetase alpha subunit
MINMMLRYRIGNGKCKGVDRMGNEHRWWCDAGKEWRTLGVTGIAYRERGMSIFLSWATCHANLSFTNLLQAMEKLKPDATGIYVAAHQAPGAIEEAIEAEVPLVVAVAEHIPIHDMLRVCHQNSHVLIFHV